MLDRYIVQRKIGEGGFSNVYMCKDRAGVPFACKNMPKTKNIAERVKNEINIMKTLQTSPFTVRLVEHGEDEENYYIIQEWCRCGSLHDHLRTTSYVEEDVVKLTKLVVQALYLMHENNIIHGDLKPSNVLVNGVFFSNDEKELDIRLCDFGNSLLIDGHEQELRSLVGTLHFMAPENLRHLYHKKSDIWSLGVLLYSIISGRLPFNDHTNPAKPSIPVLYKSILEKEPTFNEPVWLKISEECKDFIRHCLQKDFECRPFAFDCLNHQWLMNAKKI